MQFKNMKLFIYLLKISTGGIFSINLILYFLIYHKKNKIKFITIYDYCSKMNCQQNFGKCNNK